MGMDMILKSKNKILTFGTFSILFGILLLRFPNAINYFNVNFFDVKKFFNDYYKYKNIIAFVFILIGLILIILCLLVKKKKIVLLGSNDVFNDIDNKKITKYEIYELILKISGYNKQILVLALKDLYEFKIKTIDNINEKFGLVIICSLPFAAKLGYFVGDCKNNMYYIHYFRNSHEYIELPKVGSEFNFLFDYIDNRSNELFVAVQSSYLIDCEKLDEKFKRKNILKIRTNSIGVDSIDNFTILDKFSNYIIDKIRDYYDKNEIIHISFATSALVAYCFGQLVSKTIDKKIICYQFENQEKNNRPWGVIINGNENSFEDQIIYE